MEHLLPVKMDTLIKFVRFLRCSWKDTYRHTERWSHPTLNRLATEYNPKTPTGIDGVYFGEDAVSIQNTILKQVTTIFFLKTAFS